MVEKRFSCERSLFKNSEAQWTEPQSIPLTCQIKLLIPLLYLLKKFCELGLSLWFITFLNKSKQALHITTLLVIEIITCTLLRFLR